MEKEILTMVRTQEELMSQFSAIIGEENTDDNVLNFMTDMKDTLAEGGQDTIAALKQERDDLDKSWRKTDRDAFMGKKEDLPDADEDEPKKPRRFEDLFTVKE